MVGRCISPDAANPNEIVSFAIPMPISRNPDDVVAFGSCFGWNFINGFRDFLIYPKSRSRFLAHLRGKGLMNGAACQHLEVFTGRAVGLGRLLGKRYDRLLCREVVAAENQDCSHDNRVHVLNSHGVPFNHASFNSLLQAPMKQVVCRNA